MSFLIPAVHFAETLPHFLWAFRDASGCELLKTKRPVRRKLFYSDHGRISRVGRTQIDGDYGIQGHFFVRLPGMHGGLG